MSHKPVTLRGLAQAIGLGKSTVQRALAGDGSVKAETRERVLAVAKKLGYKPNLFFSALAAHRSKRGRSALTVAYVWGSADPILGKELSFTRTGIFKTLQDEASDFGLEVVGVDLATEKHPEGLAERLWNRGASGLIIGLCDPEWLRSLQSFDRTPIICLQRQPGAPFHTVHSSTGERVRDAWARLRAAGYRRIGCAVMRHLSELEDDKERLGAALALQSEIRARDRVPPLVEYINNMDAFRAWLRHHKPDAVIGFSRAMWWECKDAAGNRLPFVCLHAGRDLAKLDHICGYVENNGELARETLTQIALLIRHGECGVPERRKRVVLQPMWHEGEGIPLAKT